MNHPKLLFRVHAVQRMFERKVSAHRIVQALHSGETIEDYSSELPEPARLILAFQGKRPFHLVISENPETNAITVITVYIPNADTWHNDFKRRRS